MSSCTYLPKIKAEDNIKDYFVNLGAINPVTMEIYAPIDAFEKTLEKMTNDSNNSYFTNLKFFSVIPTQVQKTGVRYERNSTSRTDTTRVMHQLVINNESFEQIDQLRNALGIYESQEAIGSYRKRKKLEIATEQAELQQRLDAARAGVGYTDEYLFSKDLAMIEYQDPTGEIKLTHDLDNSLRDPNIKDRFFANGNNQTVKSVLDSIIKEGGAYKDLAKHLKSLVVTDIPVELVELDFIIGVQNGKSFEAGGQYQSDHSNGRKKERIVIPEGAGHVNNDSAHTIMHEIIHALSWRTLENKQHYVATEERDAFIIAFFHAKSYFENNPQHVANSKNLKYCISNVHEFMTGMLTDPGFMKDLKSVPFSEKVDYFAKDWKSFFNEIIEKLLALLKITPEKNFYSQATTVASHVLQLQNYVEDMADIREKGYSEENLQKRMDEEMQAFGDAPFNKNQTSTSVKENVQELFKSNPELTNAVYEALGFKTTTSIPNYEVVTRPTKDIGKSKGRTGNFVEITTPDDYRTNMSAYMVQTNDDGKLFITNIEKYNEDSTFKGFGTIAYVDFFENYKNQGITTDKKLTADGIRLLEKLEKIGLVYKTNAKLIDDTQVSKIYNTKIYEYDKPLYEFNFNWSRSQITPQQKQQAQQQYSQYLDTIFPDSKVKDIVYHGTKTKYSMTEGMNPFKFGELRDTLRDRLIAKEITQEEYNNEYDKLKNIKISKQIELPSFDKFDKSFIGKGQGLRSDDMAKGFYFGSYKIADRVGTRIIPAILNIEEENTTTARRNTVDFDTNGDVFVVFEPEQIHILGSKQDIKGFEKFVNKPIVSDNQYNVQLNLQNLELTNEVIDYLYNVSSQRLSRESYGKEAYKLVTNLKGSLTKEEVVEKLKCL